MRQKSAGGSLQAPWPFDMPLGDLIGARVRVVARRGYVVEGVCIDAWALDSGGLAVKVKPVDGTSPREVTTLEPPVFLGR